jgi:hypothetical protein
MQIMVMSLFPECPAEDVSAGLLSHNYTFGGGRARLERGGNSFRPFVKDSSW